MYQFKVENMTCAHCAQTVEKAVKSVDADAKVSVDLVSKAVKVVSTAASGPLLAAIRNAGYDGRDAAP
jgi:copper chaperone